MNSPTWEADFPADVRTIVEPVLMKWLPLLPTWCQSFSVRYSGRMDDATCKVEISYRNRWALLTVGGTWVQYEEDEREEAIIHELIHVALQPMGQAADRILEELTDPDTPLRKLADSMLVDGVEASVDDLARSIQRLVAQIGLPNVPVPLIRKVQSA